jgi:hypothetical protein
MAVVEALDGRDQPRHPQGERVNRSRQEGPEILVFAGLGA